MPGGARRGLRRAGGAPADARAALPALLHLAGLRRRHLRHLLITNNAPPTFAELLSNVVLMILILDILIAPP